MTSTRRLHAREVLARVAEIGPCLCLVGLGALRRERFAALGRQIAPQAGFVSLGGEHGLLAEDGTSAERWQVETGDGLDGAFGQVAAGLCRQLPDLGWRPLGGMRCCAAPSFWSQRRDGLPRLTVRWRGHLPQNGKFC